MMKEESGSLASVVVYIKKEKKNIYPVGHESFNGHDDNPLSFLPLFPLYVYVARSRAMRTQ